MSTTDLNDIDQDNARDQLIAELVKAVLELQQEVEDLKRRLPIGF